jgi:malate synthase
LLASTKHIRDDPTWTIDPLPAALQDRRVDIGDVSPSETGFLLRSLNSDAQGIQVDFDDGHCPTWYNTLLGHANIIQAVRGTLRSGSLCIKQNPPLLIIRPRAWNMDENVSISSFILLS